ncbi:hypothetical protein CALVIDRAFT_339896 [Calocera viscosa TUFC12733]|uniref:Uncharacterized protein n=1 Tax=Calocera viscosa (strain TUFC12733) TaxID=1330018 RepID=A0A167HHM6_CALVF|nr:hypothetical protein CALVIDRAFT_339896 [Calocera viscosa TUFC12733]
MGDSCTVGRHGREILMGRVLERLRALLRAGADRQLQASGSRKKVVGCGEVEDCQRCELAADAEAKASACADGDGRPARHPGGLNPSLARGLLRDEARRGRACVVYARPWSGLRSCFTLSFVPCRIRAAGWDCLRVKMRRCKCRLRLWTEKGGGVSLLPDLDSKGWMGESLSGGTVRSCACPRVLLASRKR